MLYLILGVLLLGFLLLGGRWLVNADATRVARFFGWFVTGIGVTGAVAVVALLIASDRLAPALVVAGGLAPLVLRRRAHWRRRFGSPSGSGNRRSEVETEILRMRLDHDTGAMSGEVKRGRYVGRRLEDLTQDEILGLWRQCVAEDEPSARLLETYLDRLRPDWRQTANAGGNAAAPGDAMTREQAYAILDLSPGADAEQVKEAHRRLMMKLHPDHGGSTFLAAQINRAKAVLIGD